MTRSSQGGFTLVELLIVVVLVGAVGGALFGVLNSNQQVYRAQTERAAMNDNTRSVIGILPGELRELDASDTLASDIVAMSADGVTYKAMRGLHFLCAAPIDGGTTGTITLWADRAFGLRPRLEAGRDSVMIFAEADSSRRGDNFWIHANVGWPPVTGVACPGGAPSVTVQLDNVRPSGGLGDVTAGAPVRNFEMVRISTYTDVQGDQWLGGSRYDKSSGWSDTEPLLGPLAASGLQLAYFDSTGAVTTNASNVALIELVVIGQTAQPVRATGGIRRAVDTLVTSVALRNNAR